VIIARVPFHSKYRAAYFRKSGPQRLHIHRMSKDPHGVHAARPSSYHVVDNWQILVPTSPETSIRWSAQTRQGFLESRMSRRSLAVGYVATGKLLGSQKSVPKKTPMELCSKMRAAPGKRDGRLLNLGTLVPAYTSRKENLQNSHALALPQAVSLSCGTRVTAAVPTCWERYGCGCGQCAGAAHLPFLQPR
jgi:hypothetical protein